MMTEKEYRQKHLVKTRKTIKMIARELGLNPVEVAKRVIKGETFTVKGKVYFKI